MDWLHTYIRALVRLRYLQRLVVVRPAFSYSIGDMLLVESSRVSSSISTVLVLVAGKAEVC